MAGTSGGKPQTFEDIEERRGRKTNMGKPLFFPNYKWVKRLKFLLSIQFIMVTDLSIF